jgi:hypothetical protein
MLGLLRTALIGSLVVALPLGSAAAEDAETLIKEGVKLRIVHNPVAAYELFSRAYALGRTPRAAAQLGLCEFDLNRWVDAESHLDEALGSVGDHWIEKDQNRKVLSDALAEVRRHLARVQITGRPAGAEVAVAGASVGRLPLPGSVRVAEGSVEIQVAADNYKPERRTVKVQAGELFRINFDLEPTHAASAPDKAAVATPPPPSSARTSDESPPGDWMRSAAWVSAGAGVVLAGAGVAELLVSRGRYVRFNNATDATNTVDNHCNDQAPAGGGGSCTGFLADAKSARNLAIGSFVLAGAAAATSVVFFLNSPSRPDDRRSALSCSPTLRTWGAQCTVAF